MPQTQPKRTIRLLAFGAALALAVAVTDAIGGGFSYHIGGIRISSRDAVRPFVVALLAGAFAVWLRDRSDPRIDSWTWTTRRAAVLAACLGVITILLGIRFGIFVAGGADAYGYVTQASLWSHLHLRVAEPLASIAPSLGPGVAPLGYRLGTVAGEIVPVYSPGLPIVMALASKIGGAQAMYFVVPFLGGVCVWLTYSLGARVAGPITGLFAAALLASSPTFLLQLFEPMSDVPVTMWWLLAFASAVKATDATAFLAGCAAGVALLTRPNLLPVGATVGIVILMWTPRIRRGVLYALPIAAACASVGLLNRYLYGSPFESGYGSVVGIFELGRLSANLRRYPTWLVQLHTPLVALALAAPFTVSKSAGSDTGIRDSTLVWSMLAFCGAVAFCYLFYIPYDSWAFLRFLLPALPFVFVLSGAVAVRLLSLCSISVRGVAALLLLGAICGWCINKAGRLNIFQTGASEQRYIAVGEYVRQRSPQRAVFLSVIESGSIRLYGQRASVRWDQIAPDALDSALQTLEEHGYVPYLLLEDWEEAEFRQRFERSSPFGRLDWPPAIQYDGFLHVRIYSPTDRGKNIVTRYVGHP